MAKSGAEKMNDKQPSRRRWHRIGRRVLIAVNVMGIAIMLLSAYGGLIPPTVCVVGGMAAMAFPMVAVAWLMLGAINFVNGRLLAVWAVVTLLCTGPLLTLCPLNFFRTSAKALEADSAALKVMTFNVWRFCDTRTGEPDARRTIDYIIEEDADLVMIQEGAPLHRRSLDPMPDSMRRRLTEHYPYHYVNSWGGNGLLSKYPFEHIGLERKLGHPIFDVDRFDVKLADSTEVTLINVHMAALVLTDSERSDFKRLISGRMGPLESRRSSLLQKLSSSFVDREFEAEHLCNYIDTAIVAKGRRLIVAGDFNDVTGCYAQRVIMGRDLTDSYSAAGLGPAITYHIDLFYFRIDHMMSDRSLLPLRAWRGNCDASDHYPLLCVFRFAQPGKNH